jgi:hypothetical protein
MAKATITIDERDFNIKHGQAVNVLLNRFPSRYLEEIPDTKFPERTLISLNEKKLMLDTLSLARKLIIDEARTKSLAKAHWNSEKFTSKEDDYGIIIKE